MNIYAIADLHLSGTPPTKPMNIFGNHWQNHWEKIKTDWLKKVSEDDVVLLAGDISWGMRWEEAFVDLSEIMAMPGRKILVRGNHDYWWQTVSKMSKAVDGKLTFLQNSFVSAGDWAICGSRGWSCPGDKDFSEEDQPIYLRELSRLRLSLEAARQAGFSKIIVMLHYPPTDAKLRQTGFTELLDEFCVKVCVYGHLHGEAAKSGPAGMRNSAAFLLVACDASNFTLRRILTDTGRISALDGE
ncbi:MAG: Calcineurin-like phosphoeSPTERase [Anaerosporomusa subterranea]|jgi:predicted phosphohydrolase|nr:Calcineurin-like phosphoeSPTERase [Anaerosporomusa subterranea]